MSANSALIVGKDADRAEALRAALVRLGYMVIAIATTSRFVLRAAISYAPAAVFIDVDFRCELDAIPLATTLRSRFPLQVILYAGQTPPPPESLWPASRSSALRTRRSTCTPRCRLVRSGRAQAGTDRAGTGTGRGRSAVPARSGQGAGRYPSPALLRRGPLPRARRVWSGRGRRAFPNGRRSGS